MKAHLSRNCWKLLCVVAEKCRVEETRQLLELLVRLGYCDVTNVLLGPLIKAHLSRSVMRLPSRFSSEESIAINHFLPLYSTNIRIIVRRENWRSYFVCFRDDVAGAVSEYKRCVLQHRMTPLQHELLCAVCRRGDKELLETVSGLTGSVHGRDSFSVALAAAYAETELTEQLKSLLQVRTGQNCGNKTFQLLNHLFSLPPERCTVATVAAAVQTLCGRRQAAAVAEHRRGSW